MNTTYRFSVTVEVTALIDGWDPGREGGAWQIALELYREGHVSSGKAAEPLGWSKLEFVRLLARHDIPYFRQSPDELARAVAAIEGS